MVLKYAAELGRYPNCPPTDASPCTKVAFRFVHSEAEDRRNFLCPAKINPRRQFSPDKRCDALALSLFSTREKATKFYQDLRRSNPNIYKLIGSCLSSGQLELTDGVATVERTDGHFSLWESADANLVTRFKVVEGWSA
jgi:hypothetical protein